MIVQDLFKLCDSTEIIKELADLNNIDLYKIDEFIKYMSKHKYYTRKKKNSRKKNYKIYNTKILEMLDEVKRCNRFKKINRMFIEDICKKIIPIKSDGIVIAMHILDCSDKYDNFKVSAELFYKSELKEQFKTCSYLDNIKDFSTLIDDELNYMMSLLKGISYSDAYESVKDAYKEDFDNRTTLEKDNLVQIVMDNNKGILPDSYAYEFNRWNEILGYEVIEDNIKEYGIPKVLAYIINEMTFFGYDRESVDCEAEQLEKTIEEVNKIEELPIEEQSEYFKSVEFEDNRSEDEKMIDYHIHLRETVYNTLNMYKVIDKYWKSEDKIND